MRRGGLRIAAVALLWAASASIAHPQAAPAPASDPDGVAFFEQRIRPIFADRCYSCHSARASKLKGGLRLDSAEALRRGGASGPAIEPGDPDRSRLVLAIRYGVSEDLKMPPVGRLSPSAVADVEQWVRRGAPMPGPALAAESNPGSRPGWAFQDLQDPVVPAVKGKAACCTPVDAFIQAKLEERGLSISAPADRRTLLRRATYDLTGLPPTPEETEAFLLDSSPDAFMRVVDRLLASPCYGERYGRHWLDVARYGDGRDWEGAWVEKMNELAWTYRDWVIGALNDDLPYDRFLLAQIAGDRLADQEPKSSRSSLAALGFLTVGRGHPFDADRRERIDDQIDVITRGILGLSVTCARCHDHKFDPIPTQDYYSLHGVLASSKEETLLLVDEAAEVAVSFRKAVADLERVLGRSRDRISARLKSPEQIQAYLLACYETRAVSANDVKLPANSTLNLAVLKRWKAFMAKAVEAQNAVFAPWKELSRFDREGFAENACAWEGEGRGAGLHPLVREAFSGEPPTSMAEVASRYSELLDPTCGPLGSILLSADAPTELPWPSRPAEWGPALDLYLKSLEDFLDSFGDAVARAEAAAQRKRADDCSARVPRARGMLDDAIKDSHVFVRGNPEKPGVLAPRRFLSALSRGDRPLFTTGSGRLDLARAIVDPRNPLTARVMVNRVWQWHFGQALVRTPSNFGSRGEPPTHPLLLDFLASRFIEGGWSLKKLHRLILLSAVYQQPSQAVAECERVDADNLLYWRMNRRRLEFEPLRDTLLALSGSLDSAIGGKPLELSDPLNRRRTVYSLVRRMYADPLPSVFDFPDPRTHAAQRGVTTHALQALFLMNAPFVQEQARVLAGRPDVVGEASAEAKIRALYRRVFQRSPTPTEVAMGRRFMEGADPGGSSPWAEYAQALLMTNELIFVE
jgi:mono/diheme cytochrome c family protein